MAQKKFYKNLFGTKLFLVFFGPEFFRSKFRLANIFFLSKTFLETPILLGPKLIESEVLCEQNVWNNLFLGEKIFLEQNIFCPMLHTFFYDGKFFLRLRQMIAIPVWAQFRCDYLVSRGGVTTKHCIPLTVVLNQRSSSTEGCIPSNVVFYR